MSDTKDKNCKRGDDRCEVTHDFNNLKFSSHETDTFRACLTIVVGGVTLWLESKKTKTQWQETFKSVSECGPGNFPEDVVGDFLKRSFECLQAENADLKVGNDEPELDLKMIGGEAVITLTMSVGGIWKPKFVFTLLSVGLEKIDVLEAKLRDAQEEIWQLKAGLKICFFSVSSDTVCPSGQAVVWNGTSPREICTTHFCLSEDNKTVTILKDGVYQLNVRLSGDKRTYFYFDTKLNNVTISQYKSYSPQNSPHCGNINSVLRLKEGDKLHVESSAGTSDADMISNNFTIMLLGY